MSRIEKQKLLDGWATAYIVKAPQPLTHIPEPDPSPESSISERRTGFELAISKRPAERLEVFSPTGRPVGDNYFRIYPLVYFLTDEIMRIVCNLWLHAAIIRYCELWGAFTAESFVRGYQGTARLRVWIDRVIQGNARRADRVTLQYRQENKWILTEGKQTPYPHIRRWSPHAITSARKFAREYKRYREHKDRNA
jgi:hypothetical protein